MVVTVVVMVMAVVCCGLCRQITITAIKVMRNKHNEDTIHTYSPTLYTSTYINYSNIWNLLSFTPHKHVHTNTCTLTQTHAHLQKHRHTTTYIYVSTPKLCLIALNASYLYARMYVYTVSMYISVKHVCKYV